MKSPIGGRMAVTLSLAAVALLFGLTGCGGNTSGENAATAGTVGAWASANGSSDLSGTWTLNKDLSDPPPQRPDSARGWRGRGERPDSARFARFREGGQCPDSARLAGFRARWENRDSTRGDRPMRGHMAGPGAQTMTISQTDSTVEMSGPRGRTRVLYTDGRIMTPPNDRAPEGIEIRATWNAEGSLVIEHKGPKGGTRTETFSLSVDGKQLYVATHVDPFGDREAHDFRRVYDAASSGG